MAQRDNTHVVCMPLLLSTRDASSYTGMSETWFKNQRWRGIGPRYIKIGRLVRYRADHLLAFLDESEVRS
jgi:predicted DNA-binding transcriptional regulator AlpA